MATKKTTLDELINGIDFPDESAPASASASASDSGSEFTLADELKRLQQLQQYTQNPVNQFRIQLELATLGQRLPEIAASAGDNRDPRNMGEIELMMRAGDWQGLEALLGPDQSRKLQDAFIAATDNVVRARHSERSAGETLKDSLLAIGDSIATTGTTAATLAAKASRALEKKAFKDGLDSFPGTALLDSLASGRVLQSQREFFDKQYSPAVQARQELYAQRMKAAERDLLAEHDRSTSFVMSEDPSSEFMANQRYGWSDLANSIRFTLDDPTLMAQGTLQAVGSLSTAIAGRTILKKAGKAVIDQGRSALSLEAGAAATASPARKFMSDAANKFANKLESGLDLAATAGSVGLTEGTSGYAEMLTDILKRDPQDLLKTSERYRQLVSELTLDNTANGRGWSRQDILLRAQESLAGEAALLAGAATGITGMAIGAVLPEGVQNPLARGMRSIGQAARQMTREPMEEGLQEASSTLLGNMVKQALVDPSQRLNEGVGASAGQGVLFGLGTTGLVQGPGLLRGVAQVGGDAAKTVGRYGAREFSSWLEKRQASQQERVDASKADELIQESEQIVEESDLIPRTQTIVERLSQDMEPGARDEMSVTLRDLSDSPLVTQMPESLAGLPEEERQHFADDMHRAEAVVKAATIFNNIKPEDKVQKIAAGLFLHDLLEPAHRFDPQHVPTSLSEFHEDPEGREVLETYQEHLRKMLELPQVKRAREEFAKILDSQESNSQKQEDTATADSSTDSDLEAKTEAKTLAIKALEGLDLGPEVTSEKVKKILAGHAKDPGKIPLTEAQRKALQGTVALLAAREIIEKARTGNSKKVIDKMMGDHITDVRRTQQSVGRQVTLEEDLKFMANGKISAKFFVKAIIKLMNAGQTEKARRVMARLLNFVTSHDNKVQALNTSFEMGGKDVSYLQYVPQKEDFVESISNPNSKYPNVFVHANNKRSLELAREVDLESEILSTVYNELAAAFPELGAKPFSRTPLNPALKQEAQPTAQPTAVPTAQPAVQPAAEPAPTPEPRKEESPAETVTTPPALTSAPVSEQTDESSDDTFLEDLAVAREADERIRREEEEQARKEQELEPEPEPTGLAKYYTKLLKGAITGLGENVNLFLDFFRPRESGPVSRLLGDATPAETVRELLRGPKRIMDFLEEHGVSEEMRSRISGRWTRDVAVAYWHLLNPKAGRGGKGKLGEVIKIMNRNLQNTELLEKLKQGDLNALAYQNGKALNFVEQTEDGRFQFSPELIQTAVMAGLQWHLTMSQRSGALKEEMALEAAGLSHLDDVPDELVQFLSQGMTLTEAKDSLAKTIGRFLGVQPKFDAPMGFTDAVLEALANEVLRGLQTADLVEVEQQELHRLYPELGITQTLIRYTPVEWDPESSFYALYSWPTLLEELIITEPEQVSWYGDDEVPVVEHQLRNPQIRLTNEQKLAIRNMQDVEFFINPKMARFLRNLQDGDLIRLFGSVIDPNGTYNKIDLASREAKNLALKHELKQIRRDLLELESIAKARGTIPEKLGRKYQFIMGSTNRIMMQGAENPQRKKLMREVFMATWSTLDLNTFKHTYAFYLAFAQAMGRKIHRFSGGENIKWVRGLISETGALNDVLNVLEEYVSNEEAELPVQEYLAALQEADARLKAQDLGSLESSPLVLMAMLEMAQYRHLQKTDPEALSSFKTPLYLEADGITNGPFNAMGLLFIGWFTADWLRNIRKGGITFSGEKVASYKLLVEGDLYQTAANAGQEEANLTFQHIWKYGDKNTKLVAESLFSVISDLMPNDASWTEGAESELDSLIELKRGMSKNPMTQTTYGAGGKAIARSISKNMVKAFYARLSEMASRELTPDEQSLHRELLAGMSAIVSFEVRLNKNGGYRSLSFKDSNYQSIMEAMYENPVDFEFTPAQLERLNKNMSLLLVDGLQDGITKTLGQPIKWSGELITRSTGMMANIARILYLREIDKLVKERAQKFGLSQAELEGLPADPELFAVAGEITELEKGKKKRTKKPFTEQEKARNAAIDRQIADIIKPLTDAQKQHLPEVQKLYRRANNRLSSEFLSRKDLDAIWKKVSGAMPIVDVAGQRWMVAKKSLLSFLNHDTNRDEIRYKYSRGLPLSREYREEYDYQTMGTAPMVKALSDPGVAGIPYFTIGLGDARMVRRVFREPMERAFQIYDGINIPLDKLEEYGERINQAALDAWQANIFAGLERSFSQFMKVPLVTEALADPQTRQHILNEMRLGEDENGEPYGKDIERAMSDLHRTLRAASRSMKARMRVLRRYKLSMDQMAGTYSPFVSDGRKTLRPDLSDEQVAELLTKEYLKALEKIRKEEAEAQLEPKLESTPEQTEQDEEQTEETSTPSASSDNKPTREEQSLFGSNPTRHVSGVVIVGKTGLQSVLTRIGKFLEKDQVKLIRDLLESSGVSNKLKIVYGNRNRVMAYQFHEGLDSLTIMEEQNANKEVFGFYSPDEETIYLMRPSAETLVHELIHAATLQTVISYYKGKQIPEKAAKSIKKLEVLMQEFLANEDFDRNSEYGQTVLNVKNEINQYRPLLEKATPYQQALALNEFMAWALSNRTLRGHLQNERADKAVELGLQGEEDLSTLKRIARAARRLLGALIPRLKKGTLLSIRWHTVNVARNAVPIQTQLKEIGLAHAVLSGSDPSETTRLDKILNAFAHLVNRHMGQNFDMKWLEVPPENPILHKPLLIASEQVTRAKALFDMNPAQQAVFSMMVAAFATGARINPQSVAEASKWFDHFLQKVTPEMFINQNEKLGQDRYDYLIGKGMSKDQGKRSTMLPVFLALATVNNEFRELLENIEPRQRTKKRARVMGLSSAIDTAIDVISSRVMRSLSDAMSGASKAPLSTRQALDELMEHIVKEALEGRTKIDVALEKVRVGFKQANTRMVSILRSTGELADKISETLDEKSPVDKAMKRVLQVTSLITSEKSAAHLLEQALEAQDKSELLPGVLRDLFGSDGIIGRVKSQAKLYDMFKKVRWIVAQIRQNYVDATPVIIHSKFNELTAPDEKMYHTFYTVGRGDYTSLIDSNRSLNDVLDIISNPSRLNSLELELKGRLEDSGVSQEQLDAWMRKINQLVEFMHTDVRGKNLLKNAEAIAYLLGEKPTTTENWSPPTDEQIELIDQLITTGYLQRLPSDELSKFGELVNSDREAMRYMTATLHGRRKDELQKARTMGARFNHYKGWLPYETNDGKLIVAPASEAASLELQGFVNEGRYYGSNIDKQSEPLYYFFNPNAGQMTSFNQGLIQNVQGTAYGVHLVTGRTMGQTAGIISDPVDVKYLEQRLHKEKATNDEYLQPIYSEEGKLVAFERSLNPKLIQKTKKDQHFGKALGRWKGRQVEEEGAFAISKTVIDGLHEMYEKDRKEPGGEKRYINLSDEDISPVYQDAMSLVPYNIKDYAHSKFGEGRFMVRRNMVNQVIGYRSPSIGDLWTGKTNLSPAFVSFSRDFLQRLFGKKAYQRLVWAERNWQSLVRSAQTNIVVRSIIVPFVNTLSGLWQLKVHGVPLNFMIRELPRKLVEIDEYTELLSLRVRLESELDAEENTSRRNAIRARIQNAQDEMRRKSIWPLIQAGEFSVIADVGEAGGSFNKTDGILDDIEAAIEKLPPFFRDALQQGYIAKNTALFRELQKWVQYSDFIMKAVLYDHMLNHSQEQLKEHVEYEPLFKESLDRLGDKALAERHAMEKVSLGIITEAFNNYDLPRGRTRHYFESMGLWWFLNYKIRAVKIGLGMLRNNPLELILYGFVPSPLSEGIPFTDNLFARLFGGGSLMYSFGPQLLAEPISWNPWYNLFGD